MTKNVVEGNGEHGIYLNGADSGFVTGNTVTGNVLTGIRI